LSLPASSACPSGYLVVCRFGNAFNIKELSSVVLDAANKDTGNLIALALEGGHNVVITNGVLPLAGLNLDEGIFRVVSRVRIQRRGRQPEVRVY
jgi:hypothetical protein